MDMEDCECYQDYTCTLCSLALQQAREAHNAEVDKAVEAARNRKLEIIVLTNKTCYCAVGADDYADSLNIAIDGHRKALTRLSELAKQGPGVAG